MSTPAMQPEEHLEAEEPSEEMLAIVELRECLEEVMPIALVRASNEAAERVVAVSEVDEPDFEGITKALFVNWTAQLAAALGAIAPATTAAAVSNMLGRGARSRLASFPRWLRPNIDPDRKPKLTTMTSFAKDRSRLVREAIEESTPVLISRHGRIVAAVVPLEPGAYERAVYRTAGRARWAADTRQAAPKLDEKSAEVILASEDPAAEASAMGIDASDWRSLNRQD